MKAAIAKGIDMFDCVMPMREARHGSIFLSSGEKIRILNSQYRDDHSVIDPASPSPLGRTHKKSYLHHLLRANERLGETIACSQNMGVTLKAIADIRDSIP
jgi:queuine tRNA-ribosyltransferase